MRLRFADDSLLEISEAIQVKADAFSWLSYRYHYQNAGGSVVFRYDNTPHHPEVNTHPEHKHAEDEIIGVVRPDIENILSKVKKHTG